MDCDGKDGEIEPAGSDLGSYRLIALVGEDTGLAGGSLGCH